MKSLLLSSVLICLLPLLSLSAEWKVDPNHSTAAFAVRHMMVSTVRGSFSGIKGTVEYDPANLDASKANLTIDTTTVDTRNENRDKDLRSAKFFDVEKYPTITFVSKRVIPQGQGKFQLVGDMSMHGVTKEVTFSVEGPMPAVKDGKGNLHSGASATAKVNRKDVGLTWNGPLEGGGVTVGDEVEMTVEIEMIQAKTT